MIKNKTLYWTLALALLIGIVGCRSQATEQVAVSVATPSTKGEQPTGGLDATSELVLGTLRLEGTADAVTPEQAANLLPLWTMIQGGSLESDAETAAVLKQIQANMSDAQLAAIEAMGLTMDDVQAWMQEQGIEMPTGGPEGQAGAQGQGGPGALGDLSEDERAQMREQFQNMDSEERATRMAEMGAERPEGAPDGGANPGAPGIRGQSNAMLAPLIDLLAERAA
jgi:hypothetical protein